MGVVILICINSKRICIWRQERQSTHTTKFMCDIWFPPPPQPPPPHFYYSPFLHIYQKRWGHIDGFQIFWHGVLHLCPVRHFCQESSIRFGDIWVQLLLVLCSLFLRVLLRNAVLSGHCQNVECGAFRCGQHLSHSHSNRLCDFRRLKHSKESIDNLDVSQCTPWMCDLTCWCCYQTWGYLYLNYLCCFLPDVFQPTYSNRTKRKKHTHTSEMVIPGFCQLYCDAIQNIW